MAIGYNSSSTGTQSTALGYESDARGTDSVALSAFNIASGAAAIAGYGATAGGTESFSLGNGASASGQRSVTLGFLANATGFNSVAIGTFANATAENSVAFGVSKAYNQGQISHSGMYADGSTVGDAQQTFVNTNKRFELASATAGTLSLNGANGAADIALDGSNRMWIVKGQGIAVCEVSGGGGSDPAVGDIFSQEYDFAFKKVGGTLTQVGSTILNNGFSDASMSGSTFTFSVVSNALRVQYTSPTTTNNNTYVTNMALLVSEVAF
jgi:hypothetical protein